MIRPNARGAWQELEGQLRPFVARRLSDAADVDDVLQDIYLRIQAGVGELRDSERFGPWVYRVARSALADHGRSRARHPLPLTEPTDESASAPATDIPEDSDGGAEQGAREEPRRVRRGAAVALSRGGHPHRAPGHEPEGRRRDARDLVVRDEVSGPTRATADPGDASGLLRNCARCAWATCCRTIAAWTARCPRTAAMSSRSASADVEGGGEGLVLREAGASEDSSIRALLEATKLPFDDVSAERQEFIVAIADGQVVGCGALETFGGAALVRSLAVAERHRGAGLGGELYERLVARAKEKGLARLFLLTTTAAPYFARRGFELVERSTAPEAMTRSAQCPPWVKSSALLVRLDPIRVRASRSRVLDEDRERRSSRREGGSRDVERHGPNGDADVDAGFGLRDGRPLDRVAGGSGRRGRRTAHLLDAPARDLERCVDLLRRAGRRAIVGLRGERVRPIDDRSASSRSESPPPRRWA